MNSSPLFSTICCPAGGIVQNGICYCTDDQASLHPFACRVVCDVLVPTIPPNRGGCQCKKGHAGALCDLEPCYVYSSETSDIKFYCQTDGDRHIDCSNETNFRSLESYADVYEPCPCFNGASKVLQNRTGYLYSCLCSDPYSGDLCQMVRGTEADLGQTEDQVTANTFLAIIAFSLFMVALAFCCFRRYRRYQRSKRESTEVATDYHRYYRPSLTSPGIAAYQYISLLPYRPLEHIFTGGGDGGSSGKKTDKDTIAQASADAGGDTVNCAHTVGNQEQGLNE